jgi:protein gp37
MSDLFHADVPDDFIRRVFETMNRAERHIFQVLTKRPQRAVELSPSLTWTSNIWMGVTVERQEYVSRLDLLARIPAVVRFVSCEPLIGPVKLKTGGLDWVIVGGESGLHARRMYPKWVQGIREQCAAANVPFFFKQWGNFDETGRKVGKSKAGRVLDGRTWDGLPQLRV